MSRMEVDNEKGSLPSPVEPKALVREDLENKMKAILGGNWDFLCTDKEDEAWVAWQESFAEAAEMTAARESKRTESFEEWEERWEEQQKANLEKFGSDYEALMASEFRQDWDFVWSKSHGSFEDITRIPPMRYTYKPAPELTATTLNTLQIFSAKVAEIKGGLQWPLDVFGLVAIRDPVDHNRNIILYRTRDNCQTLTEKDRNLVLIGPSRAVVLLMPHPVIIEVDLKVKGTTKSEDVDLSFLAVPFMCEKSFSSRLFNCAYTSKLSTLEFTLGSIVSSVEATISVSVISGSWPDGFHGKFAVFTTGICGRSITRDKNVDRIDYEEIVLLDSRGEQVLVTDDGDVKLSRRVVSVEIRGKLKVSVKAWRTDNSSVMEMEKVFTPSRMGLSDWNLHIGSCEMKISVAWSLTSDDLFFDSSTL